MKTKILILFLIIFLLIAVSIVYASGGRTNSMGCHTGKREGYHCHTTSFSSTSTSTSSYNVAPEVPKKAAGEPCNKSEECITPYCLHNFCRLKPFFIGDDYCDFNESYSTSPKDCNLSNSASYSIKLKKEESTEYSSFQKTLQQVLIYNPNDTLKTHIANLETNLRDLQKEIILLGNKGYNISDENIILVYHTNLLTAEKNMDCIRDLSNKLTFKEEIKEDAALAAYKCANEAIIASKNNINLINNLDESQISRFKKLNFTIYEGMGGIIAP